MPPVALRRSYVICATPRTGSYLLCDRLLATGVAGRPTEYLSPSFQQYWAPRWGVQRYEQYLERVLAAGTDEGGVFGLKVHPHQLDWFLAQASGHARVPLAAQRQVLEVWLGAPAYIWLRRRDGVRQAVSYAKSAQSHVWWDSDEAPAPFGAPVADPLRFDGGEIDCFRRELGHADVIWRAFFHAGGIEPLELWYEDLMVDQAPAVSAVLAHAGLTSDPVPAAEAGVVVPARLRRQSDQRSERWVERARRLEAVRREGSWHALCAAALAPAALVLAGGGPRPSPDDLERLGLCEDTLVIALDSAPCTDRVDVLLELSVPDSGVLRAVPDGVGREAAAPNGGADTVVTTCFGPGGHTGAIPLLLERLPDGEPLPPEPARRPALAVPAGIDHPVALAALAARSLVATAAARCQQQARVVVSGLASGDRRGHGQVEALRPLLARAGCRLLADGMQRAVLAPTSGGVLPPAGLVAAGDFGDVCDGVRIGASEHAEVHVSRSLGESGLSIAAHVLDHLEPDLASLASLFCDRVPDLHLQVLIGRMPEQERASHNGTGGLDLFVDAQTVPRHNPYYTSFLVAALLVDVLGSTTGAGWPGETHAGEGLSRVLAASLYPHQLTGFATAGCWLDSERADRLGTEVVNDRDSRATGCAALFLNYLHHQLGFSWRSVVQAGGGTLADAHHRLTGEAGDPFPAFAALLARHLPMDRPVNLETDNPFPLPERAEPVAPRYEFALVGPGVAEPARADPVPPAAGPNAAASAGAAAAGPSLVEPAHVEPAHVEPAHGEDGGLPAQPPGPIPGPPAVRAAPVGARELRDLAPLLANRRYLRCATPFDHVRAYEVFRPAVYESLVRQFHEMWEGRLFARDIPGYDVDALALTSANAGAFSVFASPAWRDLWAGVFGVDATAELNIALHHHRVGAASGRPHNDLNPGWFVDEGRPDGINVHDPTTCHYRNGTTPDGRPSFVRVRSVALLFYFANAEHHPGQGGATGLYRSASDPVDRPTVTAAPVNNSLLAFSCTPVSFHAFMTNPVVERNCLVMWLHQREEDAVARYGKEGIVGW